MEDTVGNLYGNRVRVRTCGICVRRGAILLVKHRELAEGGFWAPPGGGLEFGEPTERSLIREFREETGLRIKVNSFLFICEFVRPPLHAVELFFSVTVTGGVLKNGSDPEAGDSQIIEQVDFKTWKEIKKLGRKQAHGIFGYCRNISQINRLKGHFKV